MKLNEADIPAACVPTLTRIQQVLDGEAPASALATDPHAESCCTCRERLQAARLIVAGLTGTGSVTVPSRLSGAILEGVEADRRLRSRRRIFATVGSLAAAAAIVVAVWVMSGGQKQPEIVERPPAPAPSPPPQLPAPAPVPAPAPAPQPVRIDAELARAGEALRDSSRALAEPLESGPKLLGGLSEGIFKPAAFNVSADLEPAGKSLAELPVAARTGLEPVTVSTEKAFRRLIEHVAAMQPAPPK